MMSTNKIDHTRVTHTLFRRLSTGAISRSAATAHVAIRWTLQRMSGRQRPVVGHACPVSRFPD